MAGVAGIAENPLWRLAGVKVLGVSRSPDQQGRGTDHPTDRP
jgi:hypothetical protein